MNFKKLKRKTCQYAAFSVALLLATPSSAASFDTLVPAFAKVKAAQQNLGQMQWKHYYSNNGKCTIALPNKPEHMKQVMSDPQTGNSMNYDVYLAAFEKKAVYMVLIANYPEPIKVSDSIQSLENFLNGLLTQNPHNKLLFADITTVGGCKALDFIIEAKGVLFQGRAILSETNMYLLAMECQRENYQEQHYTYFIQSFQFGK
ncbi:hypothetical protein COB21_04590 [Candidatus Aerophobetes bacterium]|uniref:Uncharacterized protein n=1 Tax=Aerophobetes bacterium TaxID=2030807 RepID=A0A2A4X0Y2_UNCAE|nr:MAG: hypothetical protein COB21_04590 [Candidatus Aerophobetes bacterium]